MALGTITTYICHSGTLRFYTCPYLMGLLFIYSAQVSRNCYFVPRVLLLLDTCLLFPICNPKINTPNSFLRNLIPTLLMDLKKKNYIRNNCFWDLKLDNSLDKLLHIFNEIFCNDFFSFIECDTL